MSIALQINQGVRKVILSNPYCESPNPVNLPVNLNPEYPTLAFEISFPHHDAWFYRIGTRAIYFIQNFST